MACNPSKNTQFPAPVAVSSYWLGPAKGLHPYKIPVRAWSGKSHHCAIFIFSRATIFWHIIMYLPGNPEKHSISKGNKSHPGPEMMIITIYKNRPNMSSEHNSDVTQLKMKLITILNQFISTDSNPALFSNWGRMKKASRYLGAQITEVCLESEDRFLM